MFVTMDMNLKTGRLTVRTFVDINEAPELDKIGWTIGEKRASDVIAMINSSLRSFEKSWEEKNGSK